MSTPTTSYAVSPDSGRHWADPGAWRVAEGVHRVPLPLPNDGLRAVNVYAIETPEGLTLVDGGWAIADARVLLEKSLAEIGAGVGDITHFLVTHVHRDHYTMASLLGAEVGAHVSLGSGERPTLDHLHAEDPTNRHTFALLREAGAPALAEQWERFAQGTSHDLAVWGYPDAWLEGDLTVAVGERTVDAVHTPGHTRGHYVFAERAAGLLFAGDHVLPTITPSIGFEAVPAAQPLGDFLASLTKVRGLPDLTLLPAHGPLAASTHARVDELLDHHEQRLAQCLAAVRGGASTAAEVAGELPWTRHARTFASLDSFNAGLAALETKAHLELLVARGEATRSERSGVVAFHPRPLSR